MYFKSRAEAGQKLAAEISKKYQGSTCAVVALSDGGVMVGAQIAMQLKCVLTMLISESIELPREIAPLAGITEGGELTYNTAYSPGQIEDFLGEYRGLVEQEKLTKMQSMHRLTGKEGLIRKDLLKGHTVILVSDGLASGFSIEIAIDFLKTINTAKIIVATPLASIAAVDRMHILADDIFCLSVVEDYISTDHYYDVQDVPSHDLAVKTVSEVVSHWR